MPSHSLSVLRSEGKRKKDTKRVGCMGVRVLDTPLSSHPLRSLQLVSALANQGKHTVIITA